MTREQTTSGSPVAQPGRRSSLAPVWAVVMLSIMGAAAVQLGHRFAPSAVVDLGPTDGHYVRDFRDVERDGPDYFRWSTTPASTIQFPMRFCGPGSLRLRARRHFLDPAVISVSLSGSVLGQRSVRAREDHPYEIIIFDVPVATCTTNASVLLEASVENDRPMGIAVDWAEIRTPAGFVASNPTLVRGALIVGLTSATLLAAGTGVALASTGGGLLAALIAVTFASAPVAAERMLRGGLIALGLTLVVGGAIAKLAGAWRLPHRYLGGLVAITLLTVLSRVAFLHPSAFYPDYRVHALVQQTLNRGGLSAFLGQLFEVQYARSLGLQQIGGRWYPFPYPPGAYVLAEGVGRLFGMDALDSATVAAVTFGSLIPILTLGAGLALRLSPPTSAAGALYVAFHPLLVRRLALGYFPGLAGQFLDAVAILVLLSVVRRATRPGVQTAWLAGVLLTAFLVYTQSIANFGLLIAGLLIIELLRPSEGGRWASLRVAIAALVALGISGGLFYARYAPVFDNVRNHRAQPESVVLERLERLRENALATTAQAEADDLNDPYAGTSLNPLRGLQRLASRLWRFNGPFVLLLAFGGWLLGRQLHPSMRNLVVAWAAVALWISLLAAGLPSPNGFQHLKDLEFVTPLGALAMGLATESVYRRSRAAARMLLAAWLGFAGFALFGEWSQRLLHMADM
ncbi:MAG: hypothetical protein K1Y01_08800 [Vicinamibacteria bacterium]|nr:hypothetical protein [Vicinamibacteria bacterium]